MARCCKTCEYWCYEEYSQGHVCVNRLSENIADFTEAEDCCFEYEEKENLTKEEILGFLADNIAEQKRLLDKLKECDDS